MYLKTSPLPVALIRYDLGISGPEPARVQDVTPNFFRLLGVIPCWAESCPEEMQELTQTVVISHAFWKTHFNATQRFGKSFTQWGCLDGRRGYAFWFAPFYGILLTGGSL